jgi:hypothetical protein
MIRPSSSLEKAANETADEWRNQAAWPEGRGKDNARRVASLHQIITNSRSSTARVASVGGVSYTIKQRVPQHNAFRNNAVAAGDCTGSKQTARTSLRIDYASQNLQTWIFIYAFHRTETSTAISPVRLLVLSAGFCGSEFPSQFS